MWPIECIHSYQPVVKMCFDSIWIVSYFTELPYNDYFEYFGPDFKLHISPSNMTNQNTNDYLEKIKWVQFTHHEWIWESFLICPLKCFFIMIMNIMLWYYIAFPSFRCWWSKESIITMTG